MFIFCNIIIVFKITPVIAICTRYYRLTTTTCQEAAMAAHHDKDPSIGSQEICMEEQENVFISLINECSDPIGVKDKKSKIIFMNQSFGDLFGGFNLLNKSFGSEYDLFRLSLRDGESIDSDSKGRESYLLIILNSIDGYYYPYLLDNYYFPDYYHFNIGGLFYIRKVKSIFIDGTISRYTHFKINTPCDDFSKREWDVLFLLLQELSVNDIATKLGLSPKTIRNHKQNIYEKARVCSFHELKKYCMDRSYEYYYPREYLSKSYVVL